MQYLLYLGGALFLVGLILSHVVVAITRKPVRSGEGISKRQRVLMWAAAAMTVLGFALAAVGFTQSGP